MKLGKQDTWQLSFRSLAIVRLQYPPTYRQITATAIARRQADSLLLFVPFLIHEHNAFPLALGSTKLT